MAEIPVVSSHMLHGLPAFIRREMGEKALRQANRAVGLDLELIEGENCFIPHAAVIGFVEATGRAAGEANFGVLIAPDDERRQLRWLRTLRVWGRHAGAGHRARHLRSLFS